MSYIIRIDGCLRDPDDRAQRFAQPEDAFRFWKTGNGRTRADGHPDRPLTAFTIAVELL